MKCKPAALLLGTVALASTSYLANAQIIVAPPSPVDAPTVAQVGGSTAYVPMEHGSCDPWIIDCANHVLASPDGNLAMGFKAGMSCSEGKVSFLRIRTAGGPSKTLIRRATRSSVSRNTTLEPWKAKDFEKACQGSLGGAWGLPNHHKNGSATVKKTITKRIYVDGRCSGWANNVTRTTVAAVTLTCKDLDF